jgi:hypothetical protein
MLLVKMDCPTLLDIPASGEWRCRSSICIVRVSTVCHALGV